MSLAEEYRRQRAWRDWPVVLERLPLRPGTRVLDLGCGAGDAAAELVARGAEVLGIDANPELVAAARVLGLELAEFRVGDLRALELPAASFDGLWCSFVPAYFPDLAPELVRWARFLRPGGWLAMTEVDDLFAHEPLEPRVREILAAYVDEALASGRYDFRMGRKLRAHAARAGLTVSAELALADPELAGDGPASPEVLEAWRARFERMQLLRQRCGDELERVRDAFLACLADPGHRAGARVVGCLATR
ncbi:MAG TPA: methyltransferase domain-containing protein [Planctomycetota bacterium]